jgi:hypothetical protein
MHQFAKQLNELFPFFSFYWLGNRSFEVYRPYVEYNAGTGETTHAHEYVGNLVRYPHSPCWQAYEEVGGHGPQRHDWAWQAPIRYSLPAALRELLARHGLSTELDQASVVRCIEAEDDILRSEEHVNAA